MGEQEFQKFGEILRTGEAEEVAQLLANLDPFLRRAIRMRLTDRRVRRAVDTGDIFQSLVKDILSREGTGRTAASFQELCAYFAAAARYKIAAKFRKERRYVANLDSVPEPVSSEPEPSQAVEDSDLAEAVKSRLDERNRRLFDLSQQGKTWRQIAEEVGGHPDALRFQLRRSVATAIAKFRHGKSSDVN